MKNFKIVIILLNALNFCAIPSVFAKSQKAHEHGKAQLGVSIEGSKVGIDFESPAEAIYGFEHEAKKASDKKKRDDAVQIFQNKISEMITFDSSLKCKFKEKEIEAFVVEKEDDHDNDHKKEKSSHKHHGQHGEFHAEYEVTCEKSPVGSEVLIAIKKFFPKIKSLKVVILSEKTQNEKTLTSSQEKVKL